MLARRAIFNRPSLPVGYVADSSALNAEYETFYGAPLDDPPVQRRFRQAAEAAGQGSLAGATSVLETVVNTVGLPVVFHDLGVGYAGLGDVTRAADAFREVLARDPEYAPTKKFLHESKIVAAAAAEPYAREQEPNNDRASANLIALRGPVGGELAGSNDEADYFKVVTPASPRDVVSIHLENHSIDFAPRLRVYDGSLKAQTWGEKTGRPGESVTVSGGPPPNSVLYIGVTAESAHGGLYLLTVKADKAFDRYEPNDDLRTAKRISTGEDLSASIMDGSDVDFFSFRSPRRGTVTIDIRNRSNTLIPAMTMYTGDRRNLGFAQEQHQPGSNLRYVLDANQDEIYYVQIASQAGTFGGYTMRVD